MTFFDGFSMNGRGGGSLRSPIATGLRVCDSRVVLRTITGVSNSLRQIEGQLGEIERLLRIARLEHRHGGERAVNARVLLVLRAVNAGIVAHGEDQPAVHADIGYAT